MARSRKIKNIRVREVSFVDKPANLRPFMFVKSADGTPADPADDPADIEKAFKDLDLSIKSDGTSAGTAIILNGRSINNLRGFLLSLSSIGEDMSIYAEYTIENTGKTADGFSRTNTYRLSKSDDDPEVVDLAKVAEADIKNVEAYLEDLPANLRESVQNIITAVRPAAEATTKEQTMPENTDGKEVKETAVPAPVVDVKEIATAVVALLGEQGVSADGIKSAVLGQIAADRKVADDAAAVETKAHADRVESGDELEFTSEDDMNASLAATANQEALDEAETGSV